MMFRFFCFYAALAACNLHEMLLLGAESGGFLPQGVYCLILSN